MASTPAYDVAVIGAGIGGYVAAIRCSQLGKKVALIEKDKLGGTCVNWGCIPTKTLLTTANFLNLIKRSEELGVHVENVAIDFQKVMERKDAVVSRLIEGVDFLVEKNKIQLIKGKGTIISRNQINVTRPDGTNEIIDTKHMIIATGLENPQPSYAKIDEDRILSTKGALSTKEIPKNMVIIGGNVIGIEFAYIFRALGSEAKLLEAGRNILPTLDNDLGRTYQRVLKKIGIEVYLETEVKTAVTKPNGKVSLNAISKGSPLEIETDKVLITGNGRPLLGDLCLEKVGIQTKAGFIIVDNHMKTMVPNIYAVGDVTGGKMFAHAAVAQGIVAAENIAGLGTAIDPKTIPTCIYSSPEVASIGLSEDEAKGQGYTVAVGKFHLLASGSAQTTGEREGFAKIVCDEESQEILGVHLVAPHATEIIGEATLAMKLECTAEELGSLIHAHPTISEALMEAARAISKKAIQM